MSGRTIYPFSMRDTKGYPAPPQRPERETGKPKPSAFHPENFSIEVNNRDEKFKSGLRRKSFAGETRHPILRQLSGGRISIPIEHIDEETDDVGTSIEKNIHSTRITRPRKMNSRNSARKQQEIGLTSKPVKSQKLKPKIRSSALFQSLVDDTKQKDHQDEYEPPGYEPKKYEEQWSIEKDPPPYNVAIMPEGYDTEVNRTISRELETLHLERKSREKQKKKLAIREEHDSEIRKQDEFMKKQYKLHRFHVVPDGNCLYRAVAQAILLDQSQHLLLRQLAVDHIREHKDEFKDIIEGDIDVFLSAAQLDGEWAGYPEILALSRLLEININITTGGTPRNPNVHTRLHYFAPIEMKEKKQDPSPKEKDEYIQRQSIWLSWLSNGHYDTFTENILENPHFEEWLLSRESRIRSDAAMANQMHLDEETKILYENEPIYDKANDVQVCAVPMETTINPTISLRKEQQNYNLDDWYMPDMEAAFKSRPDDLYSHFPPETSYSHATAPSPEPHQYPVSTFSKETSGSTQVEEPPPYSALSTSTDYDEEIARNLQRQENEDADRAARKFSGYYYA